MTNVLCLCHLLTGLPFPSHSLFLQGQGRARHHGQCCEECATPDRSCSSGGVLRYQDEMWKGSACEFCMCDQGQVTCQTGECAKVACALVRHEVIFICSAVAPPSRWWVLPPSWQQREWQEDCSHFQGSLSTEMLG